jgi:hypothetical protein
MNSAILYSAGGAAAMKHERFENNDGTVTWVPPKGTHFIAVELAVYSRVRLASLAAAFGDAVVVMHEGRCRSRYLAAFDLGGWQLSADQEIRRFVALVRALPRPARRLWDGAQSRIFDIGIQARPTPRSHALQLSQDTIDAVSSVRARLAVTTYAHEARPRLKARAVR